MVVIAHISDSHLGYRTSEGVRGGWDVERKTRRVENDFYESWERVLKEIADRKDEIDLIVHAGDLFDTPWLIEFDAH